MKKPVRVATVLVLLFCGCASDKIGVSIQDLNLRRSTFDLIDETFSHGLRVRDVLLVVQLPKAENPWAQYEYSWFDESCLHFDEDPDGSAVPGATNAESEIVCTELLLLDRLCPVAMPNVRLYIRNPFSRNPDVLLQRYAYLRNNHQDIATDEYCSAARLFLAF